MEIPSSPWQLIFEQIRRDLESLPEESSVQVPAECLLGLLNDFQDAVELANGQQVLINAIVENS
jgi:hypothetical protein|tara:strand:+ start:413 stop:604 length:192 start_codon:yes stop_codon:yes gene_type:complete